MTNKPRKTGLGAKAFFNAPTNQSEQELPAGDAVPPTPSAATQPVAQATDTASAQRPTDSTQAIPSHPEKVKTTINLSSDTLALLDALKIDARKQRRKATYSDILDEAIRDLASKRGIKTTEP